MVARFNPDALVAAIKHDAPYHRFGLSDEWSEFNPCLRSDELGFETDTGKFKIGNGYCSWNNLAYHEENRSND
jgi:hypothetical protein